MRSGTLKEVAALELFRGQVRKPHLDEIQPRGTRGHKVKKEPRMAAEPPLNRRMLVRRKITTIAWIATSGGVSASSRFKNWRNS